MTRSHQDSLDRLGLLAPHFCEGCGLHRDQLGDPGVAPIRECGSCGRALCPNCWNLTRGACLRCAPFALPGAAKAPTRVKPVPAAEPPTADDGGEPQVAAAAPSHPGRARTVDPIEPAPKRVRLGRPKGKGAKSTTAAALAAPEWPVAHEPPALDAPWPSRDSDVAPIPTQSRLAAADVQPRRLEPRRGGARTASLIGLLVVLVAMVGVGGLALAAFDHLPATASLDGSASPTVSAPTTEAPSSGSSLGPTMTHAEATTDPAGAARTDDPATPGSTRRPGATPRPTAAVLGGPTPTPTPAATATPTPAPTPTPTPEPTPTPTPEPTPTPTPTPEPTPTPTDP